MKNKKLYFVLFGIFTFIFFLYNTLPYDIMKENIVQEIQKNIDSNSLPLEIKIKSLRPYWVSGIEIRELELNNSVDFKHTVVLNSVIVRLQLLPIFLGRISLSVSIQQKNGSINSLIAIPIIPLFSGNAQLDKIFVSIKSFSIEEIAYQLLASLKYSNNSSLALIQPVISKTTIGGDLNGTVDYRLDKKSNITLNINNFYLNINNDLLRIPKQNFTDAKISFLIDGKDISAKNNEGISFKSQNLSVRLNGSIQKSSRSKNTMQADLNLELLMSGEIEKNFGFLIAQLIKCPPSSHKDDGSMNVKLFGALGELQCM